MNWFCFLIFLIMLSDAYTTEDAFPFEIINQNCLILHSNFFSFTFLISMNVQKLL